jgi:hypothetical protein
MYELSRTVKPTERHFTHSVLLHRNKFNITDVETITDITNTPISSQSITLNPWSLQWIKIRVTN